MSSPGLDDPAVAEMLRQALVIIDGPVEDCWSAFLMKKEGRTTVQIAASKHRTRTGGDGSEV